MIFVKATNPQINNHKVKIKQLALCSLIQLLCLTLMDKIKKSLLLIVIKIINQEFKVLIIKLWILILSRLFLKQDRNLVMVIAIKFQTLIFKHLISKQCLIVRKDKQH
jgi:hypothetical protein